MSHDSYHELGVKSKVDLGCVCFDDRACVMSAGGASEDGGDAVEMVHVHAQPSDQIANDVEDEVGEGFHGHGDGAEPSVVNSSPLQPTDDVDKSPTQVP